MVASQEGILWSRDVLGDAAQLQERWRVVAPGLNKVRPLSGKVSLTRGHQACSAG